MSYGSVRQYHKRMLRLRRAGEKSPVAVTCHACSGEESPCASCAAALDGWAESVRVLFPPSLQRLGMATAGTLRELVR